MPGSIYENLNFSGAVVLKKIFNDNIKFLLKINEKMVSPLVAPTTPWGLDFCIITESFYVTLNFSGLVVLVKKISKDYYY
jgi:hypothetical protein